MTMESRIQSRVRHFERDLIPLKTFIAKTQLPSLISFTETFFDGFRTLGIGELYARQFERESQIKELAGRAKLSQASFKKQNDLGIQRINDAIPSLRGIAKELSAVIDPKNLKKVESKIKEQVNEFKLQCVEMEIKGRDVERLIGAVDEAVASLKAGGYDGLTGLMEKKMKELVNLRKSPNRGAIDNFPVWKVVAIIIALGAWIVGIIHCGFFNCSLAAGTAYTIVFAVAAAVASFC
jgi:hypothetical protein